MKLKIKILMMAFVASVAFAGCYKDILSPGQDPNAPPQFVSFSGDLQPIFTANCALSGCHDGASHNPDLREGTSYQSLTTKGFVNTLVPNQSKIYNVVYSGEMPPSGALKPADMQRILDWIRNGAPNN
jgi:hypothetical protein